MCVILALPGRKINEGKHWSPCRGQMRLVQKQSVWDFAIQVIPRHMFSNPAHTMQLLSRFSLALVTQTQNPGLPEGKRTAYPQFSFHVCSRLNEIAFISVTLHYVTMSLGGENSCRKVRVWIISGKYYLQLWWMWCSSRLPGQFVSLLFIKEVNVTKKFPRGPPVDRHVCADTHKDETYYPATRRMYK